MVDAVSCYVHICGLLRHKVHANKPWHPKSLTAKPGSMMPLLTSMLHAVTGRHTGWRSKYPSITMRYLQHMHVYETCVYETADCYPAEIADMMEDDPELWLRRPLSSQLQQYAAADVSQLLSLAEILSTKLGEVGHATVLALSQTSSQLKLPIKPGTQVVSISKIVTSSVNQCMPCHALPCCKAISVAHRGACSVEHSLHASTVCGS